MKYEELEMAVVSFDSEGVLTDDSDIVTPSEEL